MAKRKEVTVATATQAQLVGKANENANTKTKPKKAKPSAAAFVGTPSRHAPTHERTQRMRTEENKRRTQVDNLATQLGCTKRQAKKHLAEGPDDMARLQAAMDDDTRRSHTAGANNRKKGSGGGRGPFKGPSKRPGGIGNDDWRKYMDGTKPSL